MKHLLPEYGEIARLAREAGITTAGMSVRLRRKNGLCIDCGKPAKVKNGKTMARCTACLVAKREDATERRRGISANVQAQSNTSSSPLTAA